MIKNNEKKIPINYLCREHPENCGFQIFEMKQGESMKIEDEELNYLIFFLKGKTKVLSNLFEDTIFQQGEVLFFPQLSRVFIEVEEDTEIFIHTFSHSSCYSAWCILSDLYMYSQNAADEVPYNCKMKIESVFLPYVETIRTYLKDGMSSSSLRYIKHQEAIRILSLYYERDALRSFLRPMLHDSIPFRSLVQANAPYAGSVEELARLCGYGIVNFRRIFKNQFGIPVFNWMQHEKAKRVRYALTTSKLPLKEIMYEFDFLSASHFNKFCNKYLGDTPSNIQSQAMKKVLSDETRL